jgi:ADP-heptose:LPS heptosyltransferase
MAGTPWDGHEAGNPTPNAPPERVAYVYRKRGWRFLFGCLDAVGGRFHRPVRGVPDLSRSRSVLVLKLDQIGDVVLAQPLLAALRRAAPGARIVLAVGTGRGPVAAALPGVDAVLEYPVRSRGSAIRIDAFRLWRALRRSRAERPDVVVAAKEDPLTVLLARLIGASLRIGFREGGLGFLLTHYLPIVGGRSQYRELSALAGPEGDRAEPPVLALDAPFRQEAGAILQALDIRPELPLILVHPGSGDPSTRWPWSKFVEALKAVCLRRPVTVLVVAAPELGFRPALELPEPSRSVVLDRPSSLLGFAAFLARSDVLLGNESGPAHLAAAVGTPAVVPFLSGNDPRRWGPAGPFGRVISGAIRVGPSPGPVAEAVLEVLDRVAPEAGPGAGS